MLRNMLKEQQALGTALEAYERNPLEEPEENGQKPNKISESLTQILTMRSPKLVRGNFY